MKGRGLSRQNVFEPLRRRRRRSMEMDGY